MQALMNFADFYGYPGLVSPNSMLHSHIGMRDKADNPVPGYVDVIHKSVTPTQERVPCLLQPERCH